MAENGSAMHDPGPTFPALHVPCNPFILANAWNAGSRRVLGVLSARAIGTSSAAQAFTLGLLDGAFVRRDAALQRHQLLPRRMRLDLVDAIALAFERFQLRRALIVLETRSIYAVLPMCWPIYVSR